MKNVIKNFILPKFVIFNMEKIFICIFFIFDIYRIWNLPYGNCVT